MVDRLSGYFVAARLLDVPWTPYGATLWRLSILVPAVLAVWLTIMAFRTPKPRRGPDPAVWQAGVARARERYRHRAPASAIPVVLRTDPFLRRAEIGINAPERPGRHSKDHFRHMVQTTCYIHGLPELLRRDGL